MGSFGGGGLGMPMYVDKSSQLEQGHRELMDGLKAFAEHEAMLTQRQREEDAANDPRMLDFLNPISGSPGTTGITPAPDYERIRQAGIQGAQAMTGALGGPGGAHALGLAGGSAPSPGPWAGGYVGAVAPPGAPGAPGGYGSPPDTSFGAPAPTGAAAGALPPSLSAAARGDPELAQQNAMLRQNPGYHPTLTSPDITVQGHPGAGQDRDPSAYGGAAPFSRSLSAMGAPARTPRPISPELMQLMLKAAPQTTQIRVQQIAGQNSDRKQSSIGERQDNALKSGESRAGAKLGFDYEKLFQDTATKRAAIEAKAKKGGPDAAKMALAHWKQLESTFNALNGQYVTQLSNNTLAQKPGDPGYEEGQLTLQNLNRLQQEKLQAQDTFQRLTGLGGGSRKQGSKAPAGSTASGTPAAATLPPGASKPLAQMSDEEYAAFKKSHGL